MSSRETEDLSTGKGSPLHGLKDLYCEGDNTPQTNVQINNKCIKIPVPLCAEINKPILKFIWKGK
jgi:hypothetical protein